jgi:hypothetical protein
MSSDSGSDQEFVYVTNLDLQIARLLGVSFQLAEYLGLQVSLLVEKLNPWIRIHTSNTQVKGALASITSP